MSQFGLNMMQDAEYMVLVQSDADILHFFLYNMLQGFVMYIHCFVLVVVYLKEPINICQTQLDRYLLVLFITAQQD
jgi:hypothetical protein